MKLAYSTVVVDYSPIVHFKECQNTKLVHSPLKFKLTHSPPFMDLEFLSQLIFEDCLILYIVILFISVILSFIIMKLQTACLPLTNDLTVNFDKNRSNHPSRIENSIYPFREKIKKFKFDGLPSLGEVNRILYENEFKILMPNFPTPTLADVEYFKRRIHFQIIDKENNILENCHSNRIDVTSLESQLGVSENSYKFTMRKLRYFEFSSLLHSFYMALLFELFDNFKNSNGPFDSNHSNDREYFDFLNRIRNILKKISTIDRISLCQLKELEILLYKISVDWLEENDELKLKNLKKIELEIFEYQNTVEISQNMNEIENNRVECNSSSGECDNLSDKISQNMNEIEDNGIQFWGK
jgi:hypothetical protein